MFYFKRNYQPGSPPARTHYSTSTDGLTFSTEYYLGIKGGGPDILRLNDGTYVLSYEGGSESAGFWIGLGTLQLGASGIPGAPTNLAAKPGATSVSLSWTAPTSGNAPTSYVLEAGSSSGSTDLFNQDIGNLTALSGTVPAGTYYVRVRGHNAAGTSAASKEVVFTIGTPTCTAAPGSVSGLNVAYSGSTVTLSWIAPTSGGSPPTYVLSVGSTPSASNPLLAETGSTATSFTGSAAPGVYYVSALARNTCGTGGSSNEIVVTIR